MKSLDDYAGIPPLLRVQRHFEYGHQAAPEPTAIWLAVSNGCDTVFRNYDVILHFVMET